MKLCIIVAIMLASFPFLASAQTNVGLIKAMTGTEKDTLLIGRGWNPAESGEIVLHGAAGRTSSFPRLGITSIVFTDGPAGIRISQNATAFPTGSALAATWNASLVERTGEAMGNEVLEYGSDVLLAPGMNIHRNPLCGRNFEYYSEDPFLTGTMAKAMVAGIQSNGVGTSIKHFVANNEERNRISANSVVGQRALREIYLRGFEMVIRESKEQPWTVMVSYNRCNGQYTAENRDLDITILRDEWKYRGTVISDWGTGQSTESLRNGTDLLMPGDYDYKFSRELREEGSEGAKAIDRDVDDVLNLVKKTPRYRGFHPSNAPDLASHSKVALEGAEESIVLLKNSHSALPLKQGLKVALFGKQAFAYFAGGSGSGEVNDIHTVSIREGLSNCGYDICKGLEEIYIAKNDSVVRNYDSKADPNVSQKYATAYCKEYGMSRKIVANAANEADVAIVTIGRCAGEGWDRTIDGYFNLSLEEADLIRDVTEVFHRRGKKVIVVVTSSGVIETASWKVLPDAIVWAYLAGEQGGQAIAEVICGKVNPSGKTVDTFPIRYSDVPSAESFKGIPDEKDPKEYLYDEGIYVGYRYYSTFGVKVSYPFGYGLSYTDFSFSRPRLGRQGFKDSLKVEIDVRNVGTVPGKEVVQLYLSAPGKELEKPSYELKGFVKTRLLMPGESETVTMSLKPRDLASYDENSDCWVAEKGQYEILLGNSSESILSKAHFAIDKDMVVEQCHDAMRPNRALTELTIKGKRK